MLRLVRSLALCYILYTVFGPCSKTTKTEVPQFSLCSNKVCVCMGLCDAIFAERVNPLSSVEWCKSIVLDSF